jgi:GNAT superfamily N-acetyltransferase
MFADPYETIISAGGHILFARARGAIVGTCALVRQGDAFELCKMAVDERARGRGIGEQLLVHAIDWARRRRAERIELVTNRRLTPAIALYSKHGFMVTGCGAHPKYARCDLSMALALLGAPGL